MRLLAVSLVIPFLSSCHYLDSHRHWESYEANQYGYKVRFRPRDDKANSFEAGLLSEPLVFQWHAKRVDEWIAQRKDAYFGEARLQAIAHAVQWTFYDDWRMTVQGEYASGVHAPGLIAVAIWNRKGPVDAEPAVGPWLKRLNPADGKWYYAALVPGHEIPATGHELDHEIGIDH